MSKTRDKKLVEDDRWKMKGGPHKRANPEPEVCPYCFGMGTWRKVRCQACEGTGEIWK